MRDTTDMAREAGFTDGELSFMTTMFERFAELVRADERNRTWTQEHWTEYELSIAAQEREACAKVCEDDAWRCKKIAVETQNKKANAAALEAYMCAEAIRARGAKHDPA